MDKFLALNKYLLIGFWLVFVVNLVMPIASDAGQWVLWIGVLMFVVHAVEFLVVRKKLHARGYSGMESLFWVLLLGILYWKPLLRE